MDYDLYLSNIQQFYSNLQTTHVHFFFFDANDLTQPKVKDELRIFPRMKSYITSGETQNAWHIYQESVLKDIVTNVHMSMKTPVTIYRGNTNHGDHLTFCIIRTRGDAVIVKTHMTIYKDTGNFVFDRTEYPCNFTFAPSKSMNIEDTHCEKMDGSLSSETIGSTFPILQTNVVKRMCKAMLGHVSIGGKRKKQGKVVKGGNNGGKYKSISFLSDTFIYFLNDAVFRPLKEVRDDLATIQVIFDEKNYFGEAANDFIVCLYDFGTTSLYERSIFYIDTVIALKACYADHVGIAVATKDEWDCLESFKSSLPEMVGQVGTLL